MLKKSIEDALNHVKLVSDRKENDLNEQNNRDPLEVNYLKKSQK